MKWLLTTPRSALMVGVCVAWLGAPHAFAGPFAGYGNLVIVDHGAQTYSLYGNLKEVALTKGAALTRGDLIGTVGVATTGATGLYFELRVDGRPVDPLQWLRNR